jgi:hypothetical protein
MKRVNPGAAIQLQNTMTRYKEAIQFTPDCFPLGLSDGCLSEVAVIGLG